MSYWQVRQPESYGKLCLRREARFQRFSPACNEDLMRPDAASPTVTTDVVVYFSAHFLSRHLPYVAPKRLALTPLF